MSSGLTHCFPAADTVATADLEASGLPPHTARAVRLFAGRVAAGELPLDNTVDLATFTAAVTAIPGIATSTAHELALRLGERDAFPQADPTLVRALRAFGRETGDPVAIAEAWRPWRSFAAIQLMADQGCAR